jgi:zinc transport system substrate-binding protein
VSQADVLVKNGLGLETFLDKLIASAGNPGLKVIDTSRGIASLPNPGEGGINPHIGLDPLLAEQQVNTIRDGLIAAKPYFAQRYGLKGTFVVDVPEENPTPADLKRVVTTALKSQLKALLAEPREGGRS